MEDHLPQRPLWSQSLYLILLNPDYQDLVVLELNLLEFLLLELISKCLLCMVQV